MKTASFRVLFYAALLSAVSPSHAQPNFTKVTTGPIVSDAANTEAACWVDFDGDGHLDLFVTSPDGPNLLYRNDGRGVFTKITTGPFVNAGAGSYAASWVDVNNDGLLDLYLAKDGGPSLLFLQQADGSFTQRGYPLTTISGAAWGDYDGDGFVDLLSADYANGMLWHNNGQGGLTVVANSSIHQSGVGATTWADYDGDGVLDAFVEAGPFAGGTNSVLYHNQGTASSPRSLTH